MIATTVSTEPLKWNGTLATSERLLPEETAIAIVVNGTTHAVMMATPADLEDFAIGFALTERIIGSVIDVKRIEIVEQPLGIEARLWVDNALGRSIAARRRQLAGPTGCGLCGIDSLEQALRPVTGVISDLTLSDGDVATAMTALRSAQRLNAETHAVHAAGLWLAGHGLVAVREDVGRHNALDKLVGAARRAGYDTRAGALLLTSRVSIEMVQKAASLGTGIIIAVSAPTALAVKVAEAANITLLAIARADGFEVFSHPERIIFSNDLCHSRPSVIPAKAGISVCPID